MKILHLAAGNRWTGAAAPAFAEVEALRQIGIEAHYAYVGGYKLQERLTRCAFAHPVIEKAQNPLSFSRTVKTLQNMVREHGFDILHAHLTHDHWLARFAARRYPNVRLARTFHSRRTLRNDPLTQSVVRRTDILCVVNGTFRSSALLRDRSPIFTPPPIDHSQFRADGPDARARYDLPDEAKVVVVIGKLSKGRGFEDALLAFADLRRSIPSVRLMVIGHGEHRPALEALAGELGIADAVIWAGYREIDLAEHYRAADLLFFTAPGSDEGHRAVIEAMACGVIPVTYPIPGVADVIGDLAPRLISAHPSPGALSECAFAILEGGRTVSQREIVARSDAFSYEHSARRLVSVYESSV